MPKFFLSDFKLPTELPVVVPSGLVRQRPDIQASEACSMQPRTHGAVVSTIYPKIDLSGNCSLAVATSGLFGAESLIWSIVGQAVQPLINFGYKDEVRAAESGYQAAAANYRQTLLQAFRNVADVLYTLDNDAQILQARATARASAQASLIITRQQFSLGGVITVVDCANSGAQCRDQSDFRAGPAFDGYGCIRRWVAAGWPLPAGRDPSGTACPAARTRSACNSSARVEPQLSMEYLHGYGNDQTLGYHAAADRLGFAGFMHSSSFAIK